MHDENFLFKYVNNPSPTGFEVAGQKIWLDYIRNYTDAFFTDSYGNAVAIINPQVDYKVVIEAHADEISWYVNYISDDGYVYVRRNGGSDPQIAPSKRVLIHTEKGYVRAVFGWPAIHVRENEKEPVPTIKNICLDLGCSKKAEVEELGVHVGCVATFEDEMMILNNRYYVGRSIDNKIGGYILSQVAKKLKETNITLPYALYIVNSVQEEIGLKGAEIIANRIKPNVAICIDVTHDTQSPFYDKKVQGDLAAGRGPVLTYGPAVHNQLLNLIIKTAQQKNIPFQRAAVSRSTGTDTDSFAYSNEGVPSALISLSLKYMHTTVEMVSKDDVENAINLVYETLLEIKYGQKFNYFSEI
jgi:putative aminopeptidase FrvX